MNYIDADDIVSIHDEVVAQVGGSFGVREPGLLISIAEKAKTSLGGQQLYPNVFTKSAAVYEALCNYHVFVDGNKRTAALTMYRFLAINGYKLTATNKQLEKYTLFIVTKNPDIIEVAAWIEKHAKKVNK